RGAERGHHRVANELLHRPAGTLYLGRHHFVEALEDCARPLWVIAVGQRRGADQIRKDDRRQLPLLARLTGGERCRTRITEPRTPTVLLSAAIAGCHATIVLTSVVPAASVTMKVARPRRQPWGPGADGGKRPGPGCRLPL